MSLENSLKLNSSYENEKNMEIVNSEKLTRKFFYFFRPIISRRKRNAMKNYQKKNSFREKEIILYASYFTILHALYIYIYTRAFTCRNIPLTTLTFFEGRSRDTERNETKRNKTKQKRNTHTNIHHPFLLSVSGKLPSYIFVQPN